MNKRNFFGGLLIVVCSQFAFAQADLNDLIKGSQADANYLAQGYLAPALNSIGSGLNQGWYNSAGPHKKFGFDITVTVNDIFFPVEDEHYFVDNSKLTNLQLVGGSGNVPTIFGPDNAPQYDFKPPTASAPFDGPPGLDIKNQIPLGGFPVPMVNVGIGIPWETDIRFRFGSFSGTGGTKVNLFGIGIMHDIKQHIPGIKLAPFDLSAFVGYTSFSSEVGFDDNAPDQKGKADFSATTIQGIIGKKFSILTVYGGVGYNFASGSFKAVGHYPTGTGSPDLVDPISISSSVNGPRISAGLRIKLAIFTIHGDYTLQRYNVLTLGFGLSIR